MDTENLIANEVNNLVEFVTSWEERIKKIKQPHTLTIRKGEAHEKYHTLEYQQSCQQILNDLGELFFNEGRVNIDEIERVVIKNLDSRFTRLAVADLMGISIRTVRNKLNERV